ncbi:MAG: 4Fe-4S dicluster domain-containing protein, partial [Candidatus Binataceae bacterium]
MNHAITRPILWNVPDSFIIFLYVMLIPLTAAFVYVGYRWYRMVTLGTATPSSRFDQAGRRLFLAFRDGVGQGFVGRESWGWMHYSLLVGFIGLFIGTSVVFFNFDLRDFAGLFGIRLYFYYGTFYLFFKAAMDTSFVLLILGVIAVGVRRLFVKPTLLQQPPEPRLLNNLENRLGYWFPLTMLVLVPITGLMLEGARINAIHPPFTSWAYIGRNLGALEGSLGAGRMFHRWLWLGHVVLVYVFLFCLPFTKLRHFLIAPINLFFRNFESRGRLTPIKDFENAETFGVSQVEQYSWKQLLDMASCLECGRCTINCPTVNTGKVLNPKFLVISQREHLLDKAPYLLKARSASQNGSDEAAETADATMGTVSAAAKTGYQGPDMITEVASEEAVWGCTTCGWCEEGCPVGIEHIQRIVDMRRYDTLMEARFPQQLTNAFKGIENQGNPWGLAQEKRADWAAGLEIQTRAEVEKPEELDVLY